MSQMIYTANDQGRGSQFPNVGEGQFERKVDISMTEPHLERGS